MASVMGDCQCSYTDLVCKVDFTEPQYIDNVYQMPLKYQIFLIGNTQYKTKKKTKTKKTKKKKTLTEVTVLIARSSD